MTGPTLSYPLQFLICFRTAIADYALRNLYANYSNLLSYPLRS